jgi:hypothetical protein
MGDLITPTTWRRYAVGSALVLSGLAAGGVLAGTVSASAADSTTSTASPSAPAAGSATTTGTAPAAVDESKSQRPDEHLLTGDTASKVRAAALAKYPGATIQRVETDSDGVYEAHLTTADGTRTTVEVGKDFAVTGTEQGGPGGPGGPRG